MIVLRWVDDRLVVHEDFIGLYAVDTTQASMLAKVIKDVLLRLNLSLNNTLLKMGCYGSAFWGVLTTLTILLPYGVIGHYGVYYVQNIRRIFFTIGVF